MQIQNDKMKINTKHIFVNAMNKGDYAFLIVERKGRCKRYL